MLSTETPSAVYADGVQLSLKQSANELAVYSQADVYNKTSGILTIFADPYTITLYHG